jgi:hypothetical protein
LTIFGEPDLCRIHGLKDYLMKPLSPNNCESRQERQRRSHIQPGVGACAYPGFAGHTPTTLKGLNQPQPFAQALPWNSKRLGLRREAKRHAAFARPMASHDSKTFRPPESGAKATALQTLTRLPSVFHFAKRLECGVFTAALARTKASHCLRASRPPESGVAAALCHRSPKCWRGSAPPDSESIL